MLRQSGSLSWSSLAISLSAFGALALGVAACSAIVDHTVEQCTSDAECDVLAPGATCNLSTNTCELRGEGGSGGNAPIQCETSSECGEILGVETARCVTGQCVNLASEDCQTIEPSEFVADDDAIIVGFMGPLLGDFESIGTPIRQAVQMAFEEIDGTAAGIPLGGRRRPLVLVACHSLGDGEGLRAARHLVDTVKVPVIVGPLFSSITLNVISEVTVPGGVLNITPSATSPVFTDFPDEGLMWRTVPSDAIQAIPLAEQVSRSETLLRANMTVPDGENMKVAIVANDGAYGQGLFDSVTARVMFNGEDASTNSDDGNLLLASYEDPAENPQADFSQVQADILDFEPHVVVALGTNEVVQQVLIPIEAQWGSITGNPPRPRWLLPDGGRVTELLTAVDEDTSTPPLRARLRGTVGAQEGPNFQSFRLRFEQRFGEQPGIYTSNGYDAAYLIAYGMVAEGNDPVTGNGVNLGLQKMSEGMMIDVGPTSVNSVLNALTGGGTIDFVGSSGPLDFDPVTGEAPADVDIWCVEDDNQGNAGFEVSGLSFDAASGMVVGTDTCN